MNQTFSSNIDDYAGQTLFINILGATHAPTVAMRRKEDDKRSSEESLDLIELLNKEQQLKVSSGNIFQKRKYLKFDRQTSVETIFDNCVQ